MSWAGKLVPSSGTYLFSMQGNMCRIMTLEGNSPLGKGVIKMQRICKRINLDRHETRLEFMVDKYESCSQNKAQ